MRHVLLLLSLPSLLSFAACDKSEPTSDQAPSTAAPEGPATAAPEQDGDNDGDAPDPGEAEGAEAEPDVPQKSLTAEVMRGHFEEADKARDALVRADMATAKQAMAWLATHDLGVALPEELAPLLANMQATAKEFDKAKNLREAGVALGTTLARCGACHKGTGKGPAIATTPMPDGEDPQSHMQRHHWAVRQLWAGLVTASDERFQAGVEVLREAPLGTAKLAPKGVDRREVAALSKRVHELGKQLASAKTEADRVQGYGHLLATCATCHRLLGKGPQPTEATE